MKHKIRMAFSLGLLVVALSVQVFAQIPNGYYTTAEGKTGAELKTALWNIIKNHSIISYDELWTAFQYTDKKSNGKVWDMYSDIPGGTPPYEYSFGSDQCGNYGSEGDCYNREHSFPKSWFEEASPMYSDLFHLYPTDGYVNSKRSNYIFGEVSTVTWTSLNGSKLGTSTASGTTDTEFEPIDEYKGDFARTYFYMVTRYEDLVVSWSSNPVVEEILDGTKYPAYEQWYIDLLLSWHQQDPVSQKEIDRNNVVYSNYQHNRNPFIDHPEYAQLIWGSSVPITFTSTPVTSAMVGVTYTYNVTATGGNGSPLTISASQKPAWLSLNPTGNGTATLSGTPNNNDVGGHQVVLVASDGTNQTPQSFTINVDYASNSNPLITNVTVSPASPVTRQTITVSSSITDSDGTVNKALLSWGYSSASMNVSYEMQADGNIYSAPIASQSNPTTIYFKITAINNSQDTAYYNGSFSVALNQFPVVTNLTHTPANPTSVDGVTVNANVSDPEGRLGNIFLLWGINENNLNNNLSMSGTGGLYSSAIPANPTQTTVYYRVKAYDAEGQQTLSNINSYTVSPATAVPDEMVTRISVFPNPFNDFILIECQCIDKYSVTMSNLVGQVVYSKVDVTGSFRIDCANLHRGIYLLTIESGKSKVIKKVIKQ